MFFHEYSCLRHDLSYLHSKSNVICSVSDGIIIHLNKMFSTVSTLIFLSSLLKYLHTVKFTHFKCSLMSFDKCIQNLCTHHYSQDIEHFHSPKIIFFCDSLLAVM